MTQFIQFHLLTSYPPSNLNRDDLGRPKSAIFGGKPRLRISSQCLKRTWRTSELFEAALNGHIGKRTRRVGEIALNMLLEGDIKEKDALAWSGQIAGQFGKIAGKPKGKDKDTDEGKREAIRTQQLVHVSPLEQQAIKDLVVTLIEEERAPEKEELKLLRQNHAAADIAMFGRMIASDPNFNTDAAVQVAHALTVHSVDIEDDYFTAVDDLNTLGRDGTREFAVDDAGAAHIGEVGFGAGVFYLYICVDRDLLSRNLNDDEELIAKTLSALLEAAAKTSPSGKQNSFGSRALAHYVLAEKGEEQPRSLSSAFLNPVGVGNVLEQAIERLESTRDKFGSVYGEIPDAESINVLTGEGSLQSLLSFASER